MRAATPVQLLGHSSVIFVGRAIAMVGRHYKIHDEICEPIGIVELTLEVDYPLGYGLQSPPREPISEALLKGIQLKANTQIRSIVDVRQLSGDGVGKCRLKMGDIQMYRPKGGALTDADIEEVFKDYSYIFSVKFGFDERQPHWTQVWDLPKRQWVVSTIKSGFAPVHSVRVIKKGVLQDYPGEW